MPRIIMLPVFLLAVSGFAIPDGRLGPTLDEGTNRPVSQAVGADGNAYIRSLANDLEESYPSSTMSFSSMDKDKGKDKGFNSSLGMGWLTDRCSGNRDSKQKEGLYQGCARWSTGLEHETFLMHSRDEHREEYVINVGTVALHMARFGRVFGLDRETHSVAIYLHSTGVEFSGRACAGINEVNFKGMAEAVSTDHSQLTFDSAFCQVEILDSKIIEVVAANPGEKGISPIIGEVGPARSGMSSQLGLYTRTHGEYYMCSTCDTCDLKDYTGSYHISISLPHHPEGWILYDEGALSEDRSACSETYARETNGADETPRSSWVEAHMNFANMVQWVEPLLLATFGSPDDQSVCDGGEFIEGSYRTMSSGWGVPGTTDVRMFGDVGIGRYTQGGFDWLLEVAPSHDAGIFSCVDEGMGSDIRTIISEHHVPPGEALPPMDVGKGLEIRVFDNFPLENLQTAYRVVVLLAEKSRVHHAGEYVYGDEGWKLSAQEAMKEGWNGILDAGYVQSLETNLGLDLSGLGGNTQAHAVFAELYAQLVHLHADGMWTGLLLDDVNLEPVVSHNPNRASWENAAVDGGMTPATIREALGVHGDAAPGMIQLSDANAADGPCDDDDLEDLVYLAETLSMVEALEMNDDGSVKAVQFFPDSQDQSSDPRTCGAATAA